MEQTSSNHSKRSSSASFHVVQEPASKRVAFDLPPPIDPHDLYDDNYILTDDLCSILFYSDEEYHEILEDTKDCIEYHEQQQKKMTKNGNKESLHNDAEKPMRGLERRTHDGSHERRDWRIACWDAVLDEQDRQWLQTESEGQNTLPEIDDASIALASLQVTREAKQLAQSNAQQDALEAQQIHDWQQKQAAFVKGSKKHSLLEDNDDDDATEATVEIMGDSFNTLMNSTTSFCSTSNGEDGSSSSLLGKHLMLDGNKDNSAEKEGGAADTAASQETASSHSIFNHCHQLHFALSSSEIHRVHSYDHVRSAQEATDYWYPYWSLAEAKSRYSQDIQCLEQHPSPPSNNKYSKGQIVAADYCTRGLEPYTPQAEQATQALRQRLWQAVQGSTTQETLATACTSITAKSRQLARKRGLMDQRCVKAIQHQDGGHAKPKPKLQSLPAKSAPSLLGIHHLSSSTTRLATTRRSLPAHINKGKLLTETTCNISIATAANTMVKEHYLAFDKTNDGIIKSKTRRTSDRSIATATTVTSEDSFPSSIASSATTLSGRSKMVVEKVADKASLSSSSCHARVTLAVPSDHDMNEMHSWGLFNKMQQRHSLPAHVLEKEDVLPLMPRRHTANGFVMKLEVVPENDIEDPTTDNDESDDDLPSLVGYCDDLATEVVWQRILSGQQHHPSSPPLSPFDNTINGVLSNKGPNTRLRQRRPALAVHPRQQPTIPTAVWFRTNGNTPCPSATVVNPYESTIASTSSSGSDGDSSVEDLTDYNEDDGEDDDFHVAPEALPFKKSLSDLGAKQQLPLSEKIESDKIPPQLVEFDFEKQIYLEGSDRLSGIIARLWEHRLSASTNSDSDSFSRVY